VSPDELLRLHRAALLAATLEAQGSQLRAEAACHRRNVHAVELIEAQSQASGIRLSKPVVHGLLAHLPQTATRELHELSFLALLGNTLLTARLAEAIVTIGHR
jgi:hypothetical protein